MAQAQAKQAANQAVAATPRGDAIARYVAGTSQREFPPEVIEAAKKNFVDYLGVSVGSYYEAPAMAVRKTAQSWGATGKARMFLDQETTPALAALVNGTMAHCMDYDDAHTGGAGHPSAPLWAATLAMAEHTGSTEHETIAAFLTGFEIMVRLGGGGIKGVGRVTAQRGFHPTPRYATPGCAAVASVLLKLDARQTAYAQIGRAHV